jgi:hypothetical protein
VSDWIFNWAQANSRSRATMRAWGSDGVMSKGNCKSDRESNCECFLHENKKKCLMPPERVVASSSAAVLPKGPAR